MLRGRESLIRLVGKRRRFLPNRQSLLSQPIQSSLNLCTDKDGKIVSNKSCDETQMSNNDDKNVIEDFEVGELQSGKSEEVSCPVCGNKISGDNYNINSHLDVCLSRGTKRKLTQRTLFEMKFCSPSKVQNPSSEREQFGNNLFLITCDESNIPNGICRLPDSGGVEENDSNQSASLKLKSIVKTHTDGLFGNPLCDDETRNNIDTNLLVLKTEVTDFDVSITVDDISGVALETLIVGRRFSDEKDVNLGESIFLQRDPHNVNDPNAIKVVSAGSGEPKVFGFLPRELAKYLSPLIEKYCLSFEGRVISVPKHSLDVVPVQIFCHNAVSRDNKENDDIEVFRYLWKNVQQVTAKSGQTGTAKYQQNFCVLIQEVLKSNLHLFMDEEKDFIGPWFRLSNIFYPEILDPQKAIEELSATGYTHSFAETHELHCDNMDDILTLLTVSELREIVRIAKQRHTCSMKKQDLVMSLRSLYEDGLCPLLPSMILDRTGACIMISPKAESLFWRVERLFFLNGEQDLSSFLLVDLGLVKYPTYNCIITEHIFSERKDLLAYEEGIELAQITDQALDENNNGLVLRSIKIAESRIPNTSIRAIETSTSESLVSLNYCFSAPWVYSKILLLGVSFLEREHRYNEAIYLLKRLLECFTCDRRRGYWILRLSVDLEHMGYHDESLSVAESGLLDTWVRAGSRMALQRRVLRLGKPPRRWKIPSFATSVKRKINEVHIQGRPLNSVIGAKSRFYGEDGEQCGVEQLALQYYAGEGGGWQGVHTESGIWLTIFGLLMWDVLFSDVPNVFRTRFQTGPLDLETDSFYLARKSSIESHLQKIHDGMAEEILITSWELHLGTACRGVNWNRHTLSELRAAVACIGGPCLALFCRHLAQDYRSWSSGMPDLLLWRFDKEYGAEAKLVEVKGPRDRLSEQQRAWLLLLMDCGFNSEVCKVSPEPTA
ncbi:hypothetical protein UlMin_010589 [Ulmus minor]